MIMINEIASVFSEAYSDFARPKPQISGRVMNFKANTPDIIVVDKAGGGGGRDLEGGTKMRFNMDGTR